MPSRSSTRQLGPGHTATAHRLDPLQGWARLSGAGYWSATAFCARWSVSGDGGPPGSGMSPPAGWQPDRVRYFIGTGYIDREQFIDLSPALGWSPKTAGSSTPSPPSSTHDTPTSFVRTVAIPQLEPPQHLAWMSRAEMKDRLVEFVGADEPRFWSYAAAPWDWMAIAQLFPVQNVFRTAGCTPRTTCCCSSSRPVCALMTHGSRRPHRTCTRARRRPLGQRATRGCDPTDRDGRRPWSLDSSSR